MEYLFKFYLGGSFSFSSSEYASEGEQGYLRVTKCLVTNCGFLLCYSIISPFWWFLTVQYNAYLDGNHAWLFGLNLSVLLNSGVFIKLVVDADPHFRGYPYGLLIWIIQKWTTLLKFSDSSYTVTPLSKWWAVKLTILCTLLKTTHHLNIRYHTMQFRLVLWAKPLLNIYHV